jgi:hypothetical protein
MFKNSITVLIYHRHKVLHLIHVLHIFQENANLVPLNRSRRLDVQSFPIYNIFFVLLIRN